jgi:D-arabinose 1-dehydrogenase-like Zn-dependent alcohol dehydrogenase
MKSSVRSFKVGSAVKTFNIGERAGVGCFVDSCRTCAACREGSEQYCEAGMLLTYSGRDKDGQPMQGGYSTQIVIDEHYVLSTSERKRRDAERLGAFDFALTSQPETVTRLQRRFDFILDTVSAPHNYNAYVNLLKTDGTMILVGAPDKPTPLEPFPLILHRRRIAGSVIGGIRETQEMLDFCATHSIESDIEVIPIQQVNEAYERVVKGDVRFRFVIDLASLK